MSVSGWEVPLVAPGEFRLRVGYAKTGRARFLSHLEVVRALERGARRAALPYAVTKGFNPHMKVAFGPALPVGTAGEREYLDIWLVRYVPAEEVLGRFSAVMPPGISPFEARYVSSAEASLSAACTVAMYELTVTGEGVTPEQIQEALDDIVRVGSLSVEHKGKTKFFDLQRSLPKEPRVRSYEGSTIIEMTVRMGQEGSLRPETLLAAAFSQSGVGGAVRQVTRKDTLIDFEGSLVRPI
jgi:radical SAM-linked protein